MIQGVVAASITPHQKDGDEVDIAATLLLQWIGRFPAPAGIQALTLARGIKAGPITVPLAPATQKLLCEFEEWLKVRLPDVT